MNNHLTDEQLIGYVYRTLTDAERETIDDHLRSCRECSPRLDYHQTQQRQIHHDLLAELKTVTPPSQMRFAAIAPQLQRRSFISYLWQPLLSGTAASAGLAFATFGFWQAVPSLTPPTTPSGVSSLPTIASLLFIFAISGQFNWKYKIPPGFIVSAVVAFLLWLGTAVVGLQNIVVIRDLFLLGFTWTGGSYQVATPMSMLLVIILAFLWIAVVIGGGEYHRRRVGQRDSWKLFSLTITIQLFILILGQLVFA